MIKVPQFHGDKSSEFFNRYLEYCKGSLQLKPNEIEKFIQEFNSFETIQKFLKSTKARTIFTKNSKISKNDFKKLLNEKLKLKDIAKAFNFTAADFSGKTFENCSVESSQPPTKVTIMNFPNESKGTNEEKVENYLTFIWPTIVETPPLSREDTLVALFASSSFDSYKKHLAPKLPSDNQEKNDESLEQKYKESEEETEAKAKEAEESEEVIKEESDEGRNERNESEKKEVDKKFENDQIENESEEEEKKREENKGNNEEESEENENKTENESE